MFTAIAGSYDLLNHLLSFNLDRLWRRRAAQLAHLKPGQRALDLCCGTGDLAFAFDHAQGDLTEITGVDFAPTMLTRATAKARRHHNTNIYKWLCADVQSLPLPSQHFDAAGCAFGIRNLQDPGATFREIFRVLKPGGRVVILEFSLPTNPLLAWGYACYFRLVLPLLASIITYDGGGAYRYLPESVRTFHAAEQVEAMLRQAGFVSVQREKLTAATVLVFSASKP